MNIQIKSRFTAAVLFEHDCENNSLRITLELAIKSGADLRGADDGTGAASHGSTGSREDVTWPLLSPPTSGRSPRPLW